MDAIKVTKDDHRKVEGLFGRFQQAGPRAYKTKQRLAERITKARPETPHQSRDKDLRVEAGRSGLAEVVPEPVGKGENAVPLSLTAAEASEEPGPVHHRELEPLAVGRPEGQGDRRPVQHDGRRRPAATAGAVDVR